MSKDGAAKVITFTPRAVAVARLARIKAQQSRRAVERKLTRRTSGAAELVDHLRRGFDRMSRNAEARGLGFWITLDEIIKLAERQKWRCAVSGLPFSLASIAGASRRPFAPSVDRICSAQGYYPKNVRIVCLAVNLAMNEWGEDTLGIIADAISERRAARLASVNNVDTPEPLPTTPL